MYIAQKIKRRRIELKMSQQELANLLGYKTRSTIAKIESGEIEVSISKLASFARVLDTKIEYFIDSNIETNDFSNNPQIHTEHRAVAVILAGGKSTRNMQNIPNQFVNVFGKPVIIYSLEAYERHPAITDIYVVCIKGWETILKAYIQRYKITKCREIIIGGETGIKSVYKALEKIKSNYNNNDIVFLQESTRPMVNESIISKAWTCYNENGNAVAAMPMEDYVQFRYVNSKNEYINRNDVVSIQSPEVYKLENLIDIFENKIENIDNHSETCFALLMYNLNQKLHFYDCGRTNIKIVRQEDVAVFKALLKQD